MDKAIQIALITQDIAIAQKMNTLSKQYFVLSD